MSAKKRKLSRIARDEAAPAPYAANACPRVHGGVIVPSAFLGTPCALQAMLSNVGYAQELARDPDGISV